MDYGFAPGGTSFDAAARNYFDWRVGSKHVFTLDPTIESFILELTTSAFVNRPVDNIGIGCHGHWTGFLEIALDSASGPRATYEQVERVASAGTIDIPQSALDPRPMFAGIPVRAKFRIIGCEIGVARPYLEKLKVALGSDVTIIATQHAETVNPADFGGLKGLLRLLLYDFRVKSATELKTKTEVVDAFHNAKHDWYNGVRVPREKWEEMVPQDVVTVGQSSSNRWLDLSPNINGEKFVLLPSVRWTHEHEPVGPFRVTPPASELKTEAQRRAFMRAQFTNLAAVQPWHSFPLYAQRGYKNFDEFMEGYDWQPNTFDMAIWTGFRHVYRINRLITTDPNGSIALYEFISQSGASEHLGLPESDARYFTIV